MSRAPRLLLLVALLAAPAQGRQAAPERVHFNRDIRPLLSDACLRCHGPDEKANKSGLRLDRREDVLADLGDGRRAVVPGKPDRSELLKRLVADDPSDRMPPAKSGKSVSKAQIDLFRRWIAEGAEWMGHWAFIPPKPAPVPAVRDRAWVRNPVDAFVLSRLEREGLRPSPETDRTTLLRRLRFDLTGLPPTPEEADAFLADRSPDAVEKAVDRLLALPAYGERMAVFWLDAVRYADSRGYHSDNPRRVAPYRDYVISAFNGNLPFDRFTREQLAGDLLPNATLAQRVASGYNKLNQTTEEGGAQAREYEAKTNADRVRSVAGVWLGATMGCAECHDHKFDPYTMRDFYSMAAFFADIQEAAIGDGDKGILVPTDAEAARIASIDAEIAGHRKLLDTPTPELAAAQAKWEETALGEGPWRVLVPVSATSSGGADLRVEEDGSILASGKEPAKDNHTVELLTGGLKGVTGFRLEAIRDATVSAAGVGRSKAGNFVLTRFRVVVGGKDLPFARAAATHEQADQAVAAALDGKGKNKGWAVLPRVKEDHQAAFELGQKTDLPDRVRVVLEYQSNQANHVIARFRISAAVGPEPSFHLSPPPDVRAVLAKKAADRAPAELDRVAAHFRSISPILKPVRDALRRSEKAKADFVATVRTSLVAKPGRPRTVRILPRGNWLDTSGEVVQPAVPVFLGGLATGDRPATRLDLAEWICSKENPLTARTFVNRLWRLFFGTGLSKVLDDLGGQGEWPSHPELLDWLALDFVDSGWDVKRAVRQLVVSATYRQTSTASKALRERDPYNRLLARQARFRIDAEFVRDQALAVSGLLVEKQGGESVKPYQPKGYWYHLNFPKREWDNDKGDGLWRRGLYTWWQRTFIHPSLMAFDAPTREEACMERPRSNIPQQALALLNDPTYVEAARVLAARALREGGKSDADRLAWIFRRAVTRAPAAEETSVLAGLLAKHRERFKADPKAAAELVKVGAAPAAEGLEAPEHAAWTSVCRAVLNLHESITRF